MTDRDGDNVPSDEERVRLELRRGSAVFMDGTGDYHLRRRGKPGIVATLKLPFDVADELTAALDARACVAVEDRRTAELREAAERWEALYRASERHLSVIGQDIARVAALADEWERVGGFLPASQMQRLRAALRGPRPASSE